MSQITLQKSFLNTLSVSTAFNLPLLYIGHLSQCKVTDVLSNEQTVQTEEETFLKSIEDLKEKMNGRFKKEICIMDEQDFKNFISKEMIDEIVIRNLKEENNIIDIMRISLALSILYEKDVDEKIIDEAFLYMIRK